MPSALPVHKQAHTDTRHPEQHSSSLPRQLSVQPSFLGWAAAPVCLSSHLCSRLSPTRRHRASAGHTPFLTLQLPSAPQEKPQRLWCPSSGPCQALHVLRTRGHPQEPHRAAALTGQAHPLSPPAPHRKPAQANAHIQGCRSPPHPPTPPSLGMPGGAPAALHLPNRLRAVRAGDSSLSGTCPCLVRRRQSTAFKERSILFGVMQIPPKSHFLENDFLFPKYQRLFSLLCVFCVL